MRCQVQFNLNKKQYEATMGAGRPLPQHRKDRGDSKRVIGVGKSQLAAVRDLKKKIGFVPQNSLA